MVLESDGPVKMSYFIKVEGFLPEWAGKPSSFSIRDTFCSCTFALVADILRDYYT